MADFQRQGRHRHGSASGIGEATARCFVAEGALVDRNKDALEKVANSLPADQVMACAVDVSDSSAVDGMVTTVVDRFGRLDVIVNNAGVHEGGDPASITDEKWRTVMSTDVDGVFYGCRAALPHLEKTKGSIVNTASVSGTGGRRDRVPRESRRKLHDRR
jgi:meso-butanediol dehydrogenase/(S,S)-butanediol dehydrogenase/diacetyl reductase